MNIYKFESQYESNGKLYSSEVFIPTYINIKDILKQRQLTNEQLTNNGTVVVLNNQKIEGYDLHKECVAYYIEVGKYVDAIHRLMYLIMIKGQNNIELFRFIKDDGLIHKLIHLKSYYTDVDIEETIKEADQFEVTVPGSYLWASSQVKS